jgi:PAS domain S-box-containing protein
MAWRAGLGGRATAAAAVVLTVTAAVLVVALMAAARTRAASRELDSQLIPAAAAAETLLQDYNTQQVVLRNYITSDDPTALVPFDEAARLIPGVRARLGRLIQPYPRMRDLLAADLAAQRAWLGHVARPQLAAAARGDIRLARALQDQIMRNRPYVLAVRSRMAALQARITAQQGTVTDALIGSQATLVAALVAMCGLVAAVAAGGVMVVRRWLLRPFAALQRATEAVAEGRYDNAISARGPAEFTELAGSTELMRTRLVAALAERRRAEQGFRSVFESAPDATLAVDSSGTIVMANDQAAQLFGYPPGELAGQQVDSLVPEAVRTAHAAHRATYQADPRPRPMGAGLRLSGVRRDGTQFPVEISLSGVPSDQGPLVIATARDISERLAIQAEREELRAEAERQRAERRLQQSQRLESLGQLVGGIAHDFNNLLNVITGYTEFAAEQVTALAEEDRRLEPVAADIGQVRDAAAQAVRLTHQLLTFARHDVIKPEVLELDDAIQGIEQLLRRTLGEHIDLTITPGPGRWAIKADRSQLEQVLVNLAINARDAMPDGGRLSIDTGNTEVDHAYASTHPGVPSGRYVRLRVSDNGTGMDAATLSRVFEPFFTTKPKGHGTGLGLATVYGIVTQAGGTVRVNSEPGLGTTVTVLLPAVVGAGAAAPGGPAQAPADLRGQDETVLVVEDEESLRELAHRILSRNGYRVRQAVSAAHAVHLAADLDEPIDLLLTDIVMPGMLGTQVAAEIRHHRPDLPVLFMSGYAQPILGSHSAGELGMDLLEKPFTEKTLLFRARQALHRRGAAVQAAAVKDLRDFAERSGRGGRWRHGPGR